MFKNSREKIINRVEMMRIVFFGKELQEKQSSAIFIILSVTQPQHPQPPKQNKFLNIVILLDFLC